SKDGEVQPHQDPTFVDESRFQSLGLWCPLTNVDTTSGCLYVLPESHRLNPGPRALLLFPYHELAPLLKSKLRPVPMAAGDAFIFCHKLFHASQPNRGSETRVVAAGLCVPRDAQLYYYYIDPASPKRIEVFEVDDLFYTRCIFGARPEGVPCVGTIDYWYEPLKTDRMFAIP